MKIKVNWILLASIASLFYIGCTPSEDQEFFPFSVHLNYSLDTASPSWIHNYNHSNHQILRTINFDPDIEEEGLEFSGSTSENPTQVLLRRMVSGLAPNSIYSVKTEIKQYSSDLGSPSLLLSISENDTSQTTSSSSIKLIESYLIDTSSLILINGYEQINYESSSATDEQGTLWLSFLKDFEQGDSVFWFIDKISIDLIRSNQ